MRGAIDGDAFHLAWNAASLLDVAHDAVEPIRKKHLYGNLSPADLHPCEMQRMGHA
jgi:hypothetical protein